MVVVGLAKLLIVEDDEVVRSSLTMALRSAGYDVRSEPDGREIEAAMATFHPDLVLLDVRLTNSPDGFWLGGRIRDAWGIPILFVTAADALSDRLRGFEIGADDYLVKPFAMAELLARVQVVLRRTGRITPAVLKVGDLVLDESTRTVTLAATPVDLTTIEFDLLRVLARQPGRIFAKVQLLALVWGFELYEPNLVEVHMSALRRKLEAVGPRVVHTERGKGYVLRA